MSWLLLDAGNSALKWALLDGDPPEWPASAAPGAPADRSRGIADSVAYGETAFAERLEAALSQAPGGGACRLALGCAVAGEAVLDAISLAVHRALGFSPVWVGAQPVFDHDGIVLRNVYADPKRLGADRWHGLIGARGRVPEGVVALVNAGTATTVDGIDGSGNFIGGVIAPGIELMRASLASGTARLPLAFGDYVAQPADTDDAIRTGILESQLGLIERRVRRIRESAGAPVTLVLSGGAAEPLAALLQSPPALGTILLEPDVVLRGLWHRARAGTGPSKVSNPP